MRGIIIALICLIGVSFAEVVPGDSTALPPPSAVVDSLAPSAANGDTAKTPLPTMTAPTPIDSAKTLGRIPVVKRDLRYRAQIGAALGMMVFLTVILGSTQNWNP